MRTRVNGRANVGGRELLQATVSQAGMSSASAQAAVAREERYRPLAKSQFVSKQDYDDVLAQSRSTRAAVSQNEAALQEARINLRFTRVPAPISGRVGVSNVTEGALVTASQTDALTTITRLDLAAGSDHGVVAPPRRH